MFHCWYCKQECLENDMDVAFDYHYDTFLHLNCLRNILYMNPNNPEAQIMKYLLNI